jgi:hypothetical protein
MGEVILADSCQDRLFPFENAPQDEAMTHGIFV